MIKFLDLKKINEPYKEEFLNDLERIINSGWFILGGEVENFEKSAVCESSMPLVKSSADIE